ncbi:MAG: glycosyltransferase family 2 protein [Burkholderiales bacterium]|jgi:glycosyltransferase involved in cell wall biosynthesis
MKKLVIIPAYNEEENIIGVIKDLKGNAPDFDYVIINDCSTDTTLDICKNERFNYINMPINSGIGIAVQTGYLYALQNGYDIVVQFDGDGQHDASYLSSLIMPIINNEADFVIGSRFIKKEGFQTTLFRRFGVNLFRRLISLLTHVRITDATSGFRAAGKSAIEFLSENYATDYPEPESIVSLIKNGYTIKEIPVVMRERKGGKSSINLLKSIYYMIKVVIAVIITYIKPKTKKN